MLKNWRRCLGCTELNLTKENFQLWLRPVWSHDKHSWVNASWACKTTDISKSQICGSTGSTHKYFAVTELIVFFLLFYFSLIWDDFGAASDTYQFEKYVTTGDNQHLLHAHINSSTLWITHSRKDACENWLKGLKTYFHFQFFYLRKVKGTAQES